MSDASALERFLRREADRILAGQLTGLDALARRKSELLRRVEARSDLDAETLVRLRRLAARNGQLLAAAIAGVSSAADQVDAVRRAGARLDSYDARGHARVIASTAPGVERKA